jgi:prepilin-type N-terminal cleavage/methylation domain-containing protein
MAGFLMKNTGFSLLEVLISLIIVSAGLLTLSKLNGQLYAASAASKQRSEALNLLQMTSENLRANTPYGSNPLLSVGAHSASNTDTGGSGAIYTTTWNVATGCSAATGSTNCPNNIVVSITVSWTDNTDTAQSVSTSMILHTN